MKAVDLGDSVKSHVTLFALSLTLPLLFLTLAFSDDTDTPVSLPTPVLEVGEMTIKLPKAKYDSDVSLEESLFKRRSIRDYTDEPLTMENVSQLLWAAQGLTSNWGGRTAPSAGALYPVEVYVIVGNVRDLATGIYRYYPKRHEIVLIAKGDMRSDLAGAALGQISVKNAAIDLVFIAVYGRTTRKYSDRGIQYVHMEIGHAAQNVCLQATAMGLGAVTIGAFHDEEVRRLLKLPKEEEPLYIMPVGKR
jgi:SagB-type dehydrogenase family enzyme